MSWNYSKWWRRVALAGFITEALALAFSPSLATFFMVALAVIFLGLLAPPGIDGAHSALNTDNSPEKRLWGIVVALTALGFAQVCLLLILFPFLVGIMQLVWR